MSEERYTFTNGWTMCREGNNHFWHVRDEEGTLIDRDQYRHDLISRLRLEIAAHVGEEGRE